MQVRSIFIPIPHHFISSVSGKVPKNPVFCKTDGFLYDKDLLIKYLLENGNASPMAPGGPLIDVENDIVGVKNQEKLSALSGPKSSLKASIPATLLQLQNEWYVICSFSSPIGLVYHDPACTMILISIIR